MKQFLFLILLFFVTSMYGAKAQETSVTIRSDYLTSTDTLELYVWNDLIGEQFRAPYRLLSRTPVNGEYSFVIDSLSHTGWISLCFSYQKLRGSPSSGVFDLLPILPGDSLSIELIPQKGSFLSVFNGYDSGYPIFKYNWICRFGDGRGSARSSLFMEMERMEAPNKEPYLRKDKTVEEILALELMRYRERQTSILGYLEAYRDVLSDFEYKLLLYEFIGKIGYSKVRYMLTKIAIGADRDKARDYFYNIRQVLARDFHEVGHFDKDILKYCPSLIGYLADLATLYINLETGTTDIRKVSNWIGDVVMDAVFQDRVSTALFLKRFHAQPDSLLLYEFLEHIHDEYSLKRLEPLKILFQTDDIFSFELPDASGRLHSEQDYKGKVILMDFWYMGCVPCRIYMKNVLIPLQERLAGDDGFVLITVSLDEQAELIKAMEMGITPTGAVALYTDNLRFQHPLIKKLGIYSFPYPILLDSGGMIRKVGTELKDLDHLTDEIRKLQKERNADHSY